MTQTATIFYLKIQQVEKLCLFELAWGIGQQLTVSLPYPESLTISYQDWQQNYLNFYHKALRGRVVNTGKLTRQVDWHQKLVQAEAKLVFEFHRWLRHEQLYEIRAIVAQAAKQKTESLLSQQNTDVPTVDVFITCNCQDLSRLPWEAWEITEFAASSKIRIARQPINIRNTTATLNYSSKRGRSKARILAILGDDTGLNFQADKEAVKFLSPIAEVEFVGWQPQESQAELKEKIVKAITDQRGWDILFFAGHSNETLNTGGEIAIAPSTTLCITEISQPLSMAKQRGLQFAIFNSCSGLSIANALIDLGLSQVAVMREPIHNQVAQEFLVRFLQSLGEYKDVHESLLSACQFLKLEKNLTYPSTYLIPSLFRHPGAPLFRLKRSSLRQELIRWLPTRREAMAISALILCSLQLSNQRFLIEKRVLVQAMYRQYTNQVERQNSPPVLLVEIDEDSITKAKISNPWPMDRSYLAKIIDQLTTINAKIIGIDYLLDRHQKEENDIKLAQTLRSSIEKQNTWFVFATSRNPAGGWLEALPELASPKWRLQGNVSLVGYNRYVTHVTLLPSQNSTKTPLPFGYLLAVAHLLNFEKSENLLLPQINSSVDWLLQVKNHIAQTTDKNFFDLFSSLSRLQPLTKFSYRLGQMWLHPIIDFSIPPEAIFVRLPAWQLLESDESQLLPKTTLEKRPSIVIIAAGYKDAGLTPGEDNFPLPAAVSYWRSQKEPPNPSRAFTGGEVHTYMVHHFLKQRLVIPIPNLWLIGIAALLGKGVVLMLENNSNSKTQQKEIILSSLFLLTLIYALASLQIYISAAILLPWLLPSLTFWIYIFLYSIDPKSTFDN
ncbi:CHASE2 domain-containing protein [Dapis sp. BLCC M229]|uniref:CHASE2 domain-containing protein n=1 Tax=Dapis sp. BLCC M229 TaxID=3400188 RepID=UPI003CEE3E11